jgi:hypothetical protein
LSTLKSGSQKTLDLWRGVFEPGDGRRSEGFPFLLDDGGDMRRVFNALIV